MAAPKIKTIQKPVSELEKANRDLKEASKKEAKKLECMTRLEKECDTARETNKANEQRIQVLSSELFASKSMASSFRQDLEVAKAKSWELILRCDSLIRLWDHDTSISSLCEDKG